MRILVQFYVVAAVVIGAAHLGTLVSNSGWFASGAADPLWADGIVPAQAAVRASEVPTYGHVATERELERERKDCAAMGERAYDPLSHCNDIRVSCRVFKAWSCPSLVFLPTPSAE